MADSWKNRIVKHDVLPAKDFLAHPMNFRVHPQIQQAALKGSLDELGWIDDVMVNIQTQHVINGHLRISLALREGDDTLVPVKYVNLSPEEELTALAVFDPITAMATADKDKLDALLRDTKPADAALQQFLSDLAAQEGLYTGNGGDTLEDVPEAQVDRAAELQVKWSTCTGQLWIIPSISLPGQSHRLICGDSTVREDVSRLMAGAKASLCHADPPYGMGKERDGVANDNLYGEKLDAFQMAWWSVARTYLEDNASVYVWGNAEDLWRLWYVGGLKQSERLTFRNEIIWDKGGAETNSTMLVSGVPLEARRMYQPTERCLFFMLGEQGFSTNADNYWDGWEPIRAYLDGEREKMGWKTSYMAKLCGLTETSSSARHWVFASQWSFITEENYRKIQAAAKDDAFKRDYDDLKRDYYATRAYFDNTHDNMTDVWSFSRVVGDERHDHPTPKPVDLVARIVKSSCPDGGAIYDPFVGSGTTLVCAEQLGRLAFGCEIDPRWFAVTLERLSQMGVQPRLVES
jgi:DNA modification methylase